MKWPTVKIECAPEVRRFNQAVEWADTLTGFRYDRADFHALHLALWNTSRTDTYLSARAELELAALDVAGGGL